MIHQGQLEEYHPDKNDPWEFLWVTSDDAVIGRLFGQYNADPKTLIFDYGRYLCGEKHGPVYGAIITG